MRRKLVMEKVPEQKSLGGTYCGSGERFDQSGYRHMSLLRTNVSSKLGKLRL